MTTQKFYQELEDRGLGLYKLGEIYKNECGKRCDLYYYKKEDSFPPLKALKIIRELTDDDFIYEAVLEKYEYSKSNLSELDDFLYELKPSKAKIMEIRMRRKAMRKML